jgi:hypothetical protein
VAKNLLKKLHLLLKPPLLPLILPLLLLLLLLLLMLPLLLLILLLKLLLKTLLLLPLLLLKQSKFVLSNLVQTGASQSQLNKKPAYKVGFLYL